MLDRQLPLDERPGEWRKFASAQAIALGAEASLLIAVAAILACGGLFHDEDDFKLLVLGTTFGVISISAAWLALGPLSLDVRLVFSPLSALAAIVVSMLVLAIDSPGGEAIMATLLAGAGQFILLQLPYWVLRYSTRIRVVHVRELETNTDAPIQFSIWQMLLVTTIVAVLLGIGRAAAMLLSTSSDDTAMMAVFFALFVGFNLLLAWPLIWSLLAPEGAEWKSAVALLVVILATAVEFPVVASILGPGGHWSLFWTTNLPQLLCLISHLLATRLAGYRLVRVA